MDLDGKGKAEGLDDISDQNANRTEKMAVNEFWFRGTFGFLYHFFDTWHIFPICSPFCAVPNQNRPSRDLPEGCFGCHGFCPCGKNGVPFLGRNTEKVLQAGEKGMHKGKSPDDGGQSRGIRAEHEFNYNGHEPLEGSGSGKASVKG